MSTKPRVFVIEPLKRGIDVNQAKDFGEIEYVFGPDSRRSSVFDSEVFGNDVLWTMRGMGFDPFTDFVCIAGTMITVVISVSALLSCYPSLNVLLFSASERRYVARTIGRKVWENAEETV